MEENISGRVDIFFQLNFLQFEMEFYRKLINNHLKLAWAHNMLNTWDDHMKLYEARISLNMITLLRFYIVLSVLCMMLSASLHHMHAVDYRSLTYSINEIVNMKAKFKTIDLSCLVKLTSSISSQLQNLSTPCVIPARRCERNCH